MGFLFENYKFPEFKYENKKGIIVYQLTWMMPKTPVINCTSQIKKKTLNSNINTDLCLRNANIFLSTVCYSWSHSLTVTLSNPLSSWWYFLIISIIFLSSITSCYIKPKLLWCTVSKVVLSDPCLPVFTHAYNSSCLPPNPCLTGGGSCDLLLKDRMWGSNLCQSTGEWIKKL